MTRISREDNHSNRNTTIGDYMTRAQFNTKFELAKDKAFGIFYQNCPVDTGYLRSKLDKAIIVTELENGFAISNDVSYMVYTEESWHLRTDKVNPNEGWFRRSFENAFRMIVEEMTK